MAMITTIKERICQLDSAEFQILCDAYLSREGYSNMVAFGTKAGAAKITKGTPDSYCCNERGDYIFAEYTTQTNGLIAKIEDDLKKCLNPSHTGVPLDRISEILYFHTSSNISPKDDLRFKTECESNSIKLTLIGIDTLAENICTKYPTLAKKHLSLSIDSGQIQTYEDFVEQHDENKIASPIQTTFLFREEDLTSIADAFNSFDIVLLSGPAGVGKTRLALQYAKTRAESTCETLYCVHSCSLPIMDDIFFYFEKPGNYFVFIDDANQLSHLEYIINYVNKKAEGYAVKILISVRDYALKRVQDEIGSVANYTSLSIKNFTDEEIKELVKSQYGIVNDKYLMRIASISKGNARIAMLAGNIALTSNKLSSINDVTELYSAYYGKILSETDVLSNPDKLKTLGVVAFLRSFDQNNITQVLGCLGIDIKDFKCHLDMLHDSETIDIYHNQAVVFSEQCLANYVLKYVFYDKKLISLSFMIETCFSRYKKRTLDAVATLYSVFQTEEMVSFITAEICQVWDKLKNDDSELYVEFIKSFYPLNRTETLLFLQEEIDKVEAVKLLPEELKHPKQKNLQIVNDDILTIIGGFADTDDVDAALDLFFMYFLKRPDLYVKFVNIILNMYSITRHSLDYDFKTQQILVDKFEQYSDDWKNDYVRLLFLDVVNELLKIEFSPLEQSESEKSIYLYHIPISLTDGVVAYREHIWNCLLKLADNEKNHPSILEIWKHYGSGVENCNKEVVAFDSQYICKLLSNHFSTNDLNTCLLVEHLTKVFNAADIQKNDLDAFINNSKMKLYHTLCGPKWDGDIDYSEFEKMKKDYIIDYLFASDDVCETFNKMFQLYQECLVVPDCDKYSLSKGVNIAINALPSNTDFLPIITPVIVSEKIGEIDISTIVSRMFSVTDCEEVYTTLASSPSATNNIWMYAYFECLPQEMIDTKQVERLYDFLRNDSDKEITSSHLRDVTVFEKFANVDDAVIIKSSKIIFEKQAYSPFIVCIYFERLFNVYCHRPDEIMMKFRNDIKFLEEIYLYVGHAGKNRDYNGEFLCALCCEDVDFISSFAKFLLDEEPWRYGKDYDPRCVALYDNENYIDVIDAIVDEAFSKCQYPCLQMSFVYNYFIVHLKDDKLLADKVETWIAHYIEKNITSLEKLRCFFVATSELGMERHIKYLAIFVNLSADYKLFEKFPLTPQSCSWSGSAVPMLSSWVGYLQTLLSSLHGIALIRHRQRVKDEIDYLKRRIKKAEIDDALNG